MKWRRNLHSNANLAGTLIEDKLLHSSRLIECEWGDTDSSYNTRTSKNIYVKGVKYRKIIKLTDNWASATGVTGYVSTPWTFRWAIVNPKENTGASSFDVTDFFNDPGLVNDTGTKDFPSTGNYFEYMHRKINPQKNGIVAQGSFTLDPSSTGSDMVKNMPQQKIINLWIPINRVIQFNNNDNVAGSEFPNTNLYFVWWFCRRGDCTTARIVTSAATTPIEYTTEKILYFRNVAT